MYRRNAEENNALAIILEETTKAPLLRLIDLDLIEAVERPDGCVGYQLTRRGEIMTAMLECPDVDEPIPYELTGRGVEILLETDHDDDNADA